MSESNENSGGVFKTFFKQLFTKKDENPAKRNNDNHDGKDDFQPIISNAQKRKPKRLAPQPPMQLIRMETSTIYEPSHSTQNHVTSMNDIEKQFSELTLRESDSNSKQVSLAQVHIESESTNSKLHRTEIEPTKSSKAKKEYNAVLETKSALNANQNKIKNCQVQKSSTNNDDMKNTKAKSFLNRKLSKLGVSRNKSAKAKKEQVLLKVQTNSKNDKPALEIEGPDSEQTSIIAEHLKHNEEENYSSLSLEKATHQTTKCNNRNEKEEIENNNEYDITLEKIESVMQEVENLQLDIQKVNNSESFFVIEMGLTNAIIKLDAIQMSKNELLRKKRKDGIILIHEVFKQLDEHGKEN